MAQIITTKSTKKKNLVVVECIIQMLPPILTLWSLYIFGSAFFLARSSLPRTSTCDDVSSLLQDTLGIQQQQQVPKIEEEPSDADMNTKKKKNDCWMEQSVDKLVILVVDALRFDFAQHSFPQSFGRRLFPTKKNDNTTTKLLKFMADPPTVTMQRLKGLTTGGLPTFADISGNFGGAYVEEDSWMEFLKRRHSKVGFVGDDTWVDLFAISQKYWTEAHPFPSFNTRDLDTVDNGVLEYLPGLLDDLLASKLDVVIAHFLGVDHVGHTYGPHTQFMAEKLQQMDDVLDAVLTRLDESDSTTTTTEGDCILTLVFGDHGMTEGGNHGGGTIEEVQAALFYHTSPHCSNSNSGGLVGGSSSSSSSILMETDELSQIDLVPTISLALGLPIPYANLGGLVPSLLLSSSSSTTTATKTIAQALALNAAQVWRYLSEYSRYANRLPLSDLEKSLQQATQAYQIALNHQHQNDHHDASSSSSSEEELFINASIQLKQFLNEATELGKHVWTRFDTTGMMMGGTLLGLLLLYALYNNILPSSSNNNNNNNDKKRHSSYYYDYYKKMIPKNLEEVLTTIFVIFTCCLLTFSNSYIEQEQAISIYCLSIICIAISVNHNITATTTNRRTIPTVLLIPVAARLHELLISGHGLDPSLSNEHMAHHSLVFLSSLLCLAYIRTKLLQQQQQNHHHHRRRRRVALVNFQYYMDLFIFVLLAVSWWEKRQIDATRNGYLPCGIALVVWIIMAIGSMIRMIIMPTTTTTTRQEDAQHQRLLYLFQLGIGIMIVTGPSTAASMVFFSIQVYAWLQLLEHEPEVANFVKAFVGRLIIRHMFFATNHACAFNRLQYSAAFVATEAFYFVTGGISLALNTFGYELLGLVLMMSDYNNNDNNNNMPSSSSWSSSSSSSDDNDEKKSKSLSSNKENQKHDRCCCYSWYRIYQLLETVFNCLSVSILRRHLMVWAIFAPRFIFSTIFLCLHCFGQLLLLFLVVVVVIRQKKKQPTTKEQKDRES